MFAMLLGMLVCGVAFAISNVLGGLFALVLVIAMMVVAIQISVKRLHDIGWSGWLLLITLIPLVGNIFQLLITVMPGTKGSNLYGAAPPENSTAVKVLFGIWVAVMVLTLISVIAAFTLGIMPSIQDM